MRASKRKLVVGVMSVALVVAACGSSKKASTSSTSAASGSSTTAAAGPLTKATLQLQWFTQAQFAGYLVALDKGYYKDAGIDLTIKEGAVDIVPQTVLANGQADFALAWVPKALASREAGANIVDVGQIFQRSGTLQVSFKAKNITAPADFKGKKIGNWGFGNEFELFAGITKAGLDPAKDVTLVQQQFDMKALLSGDIDAAEAMTYNEYAQVLEAKNPATGKLYTPDDFNAMSYEKSGVGMLQDAVWADGKRLVNDKAYQDLTTKFLEASMKGWIYCRDNAQECADIVVSKGSKLGKSHQLWQMNEINKLVWPSPNGIGMLDPTAWGQTVTIAQGTKNLEGKTVLTKAPDSTAYDMTYAQAAIADLKKAGLDVNGAGFAPLTVTLLEGGA